MLLWPKNDSYIARWALGPYGVVQGVVYTSLSAGAWSVLRAKPEYGGEEIVPLAEIPYLLRRTHDLCFYTIQGRSLRDNIIL